MSVNTKNYFKKDRHYSINVTLKRVRVTTVSVERQYVLRIVRVCSLSYPACRAHAPYYIVNCGVSACIIFFLIIPLTARFSGGGGIKYKMRIFIYCTTFFVKYFFILRRLQ